MAVDLSKLFIRPIELKNGSELSIYQSEIGDVGCVVWDAALVMCGYIDRCGEDSHISSHTTAGDNLYSSPTWEDKTVLDLGAGTGVVGLVTACLGARTVITDLAEFVPLMQHNITSNQEKIKGSCVAKTLSWGDKQQMDSIMETCCSSGVDYIVIADCVYYEESIDSLVETIVYFSQHKTVVYCSYEERDTGNKPELQRRFFKKIEEHFNVCEIPLEFQDPDYRSPDIHIMKFVLKKT